MIASTPRPVRQLTSYARAPHVAAFFDRGGVMVMDPDPALRGNRLRLLHNIHGDFAPIADFRKLGTSST